MHEAQVLESVKEVRLDSSSLPHCLKILTYHITYRKDLTQKQLWAILCEAVI